MDQHDRPADDKPAAPRLKKKLLDLARYRIGQRAYWIVFCVDRGSEFQRPAEEARVKRARSAPPARGVCYRRFRLPARSRRPRS